MTVPAQCETDALASVSALLARQAETLGDRRAFIFLPERGDGRPELSYTALHRRAEALAARLLRKASPGDRAVLLFPPGLDFVVAFYGCLAAGVIGVPLMLPRRAGARDSSAAILADCRPRLALTSPEVAVARPDVLERFAGALEWLTVSALEDEPAPDAALPAPGRDAVALLQYTSGSTSSPKGVMVTHGNLLANFEMIRLAMGNTARSICVGWVPHYHDMGLMMGVMQPVYLGTSSVLMPPAAFMMRPLSWLRAISEFRAEVTSAPNFAFDLCVSRFRPEQMQGIDLSCWKLALNGAEPVHADTIARFAKTFAPYGFQAATMYPGYGLAEATLLVSGDVRGTGAQTRTVSRTGLQQGKAAPADAADAQALVHCGRSLIAERVAIADPATLRPLPACTVGEILVSGANVAAGYWRNEAATETTFRARLGDDEALWLRTGDLGFMDDTGALFVTGRIKDLIIIRGVNHYPQDIERTMQDAHPALHPDGGAAFAVMDEGGDEAVVLVQEIARTQRRDLDLESVVARIREAVTAAHEIALHDIVLIAPATLPKTTSGKVQRSTARRLWQEGGLERV
ncbi:MAG: fatty acyl-AMP ligase [Rhodopila sp.]